jgi:hypothetical protein
MFFSLPTWALWRIVGGATAGGFDLDRPTRRLITVPSTPLASARASMVLPPPAQAPSRP